eukprot:TRINITY_DN10483_c0_g2_i1.p1 TRINITY_DN10483_c0_g2~~TRINITY_DN10483_c0_g2_i1.p1  ORF type:complete len:347 (-),score=37.00 TRINITY_DN10483_c0_g2_i1:94-999(-)
MYVPDTNSKPVSSLQDPHLCYHSVAGFAMETQSWGDLRIDCLTDIKFNDHLYDTLVLDKIKKDTILHLVSNSSTGLTDMVAGKSGGCVLLFHGMPGMGKTFAAEALAEQLRKPLCRLSVANLMCAEAGECFLKGFLELASVWGAIVLIDDADVIFESRSSAHVGLNAMVAVLLQQLEYHNEVIILASNQHRNFDEAFSARILFTVAFEPLNETSRATIWTNLLKTAGIQTGTSEGQVDPSTLSQYKIDGRQIRNTIRGAQALARAHDNEALSMQHILRMLTYTKAVTATVNGVIPEGHLYI